MPGGISLKTTQILGFTNNSKNQDIARAVYFPISEIAEKIPKNQKKNPRKFGGKEKVATFAPAKANKVAAARGSR